MTNTLRRAEAVAQAEEAARIEAEARAKTAARDERASPWEWDSRATSNMRAPAKPSRRISSGPSMAHIVVLGIGGVAFVVMLLLIFMGGAPKEVQPTQATSGGQSA